MRPWIGIPTLLRNGQNGWSCDASARKIKPALCLCCELLQESSRYVNDLRWPRNMPVQELKLHSLPKGSRTFTSSNLNYPMAIQFNLALWKKKFRDCHDRICKYKTTFKFVFTETEITTGCIPYEQSMCTANMQSNVQSFYCVGSFKLSPSGKTTSPEISSSSIHAAENLQCKG